MHELSVAMEVCRLTEQQVGRRRLREVVAVGVDVGDEAGLEIANLGFCLDALLSQPPFAHARPEIHRAKGDTLRLSYVVVDDDRSHD